MKKFTLSTFLLIMLVSFAAIAQKGYINPAAKYCEILGYRYEVQSEKGAGEVGIVHLPDGRMVNAWDFYKGKVAQEFTYAAKLGFDVETEVIQKDGYTLERAVCIRSNKGEQERIPLLELMELNGDPLNAEVVRREPAVQDFAKVDPDFRAAKSLPTAFDLRNYNGHSYIGDPRDQGSCGSCYAFGAAAAAEGAYNLATGSYDNSTADFSEAYIAWCLSAMSAYSSHFSGCNGADYEYYELKALVDIGIIDESYFPYTDSDNQSCSSTATNAPKIQFESWNRVTSSDVAAIKTAIMTYGVVDAAVYVTTSFSNYSGGVWSDSNNGCSNGAYTTTNHAISLVGWGNDATEGDYWILRNSWGSSWGESGYMRIAVNSAAVDCAVCYMVYEDVAQAPVAGFSADETSVLYGNSVSFTDQSTNNPTSWSWSFEGGTPSTSTSQNPTVTYNTPGTYNVTLTASNADGSDTETKTNYITVVDEIPLEYCTSKGNDFSYEWIAGVTIGSFTNTSTGTAYSDFTSKTVSMTAGTNYAVSLTPGFKSSTYNEYWKIWVDLNADGDFDDSNELIFDAGALSKTTVTGTATIPVGTSAKSTRMRVSMKYNAAQTACESFSYGEVEDYTVVISTGSVDTQAPTAPTSLSSSSITQTTFTLSWNAATDNVGVTGYDVYQNGSSIGSVTGTSANITGLTANTTYAFYVKAKDAAGNVSSASSTLNVTTLANQVSYCTSKGNNSSYEWIDYVALGSMTNSTAANGGYADFTSKVAEVVLGGSETMYVSCAFKSSTYTEYWHVWIDWDHSGTFDSDEQMISGSSSSDANLSATFTVPSDATLGTTRMRVTMKYNAAATACETFSYGEVEDYTVNVVTSRSGEKLILNGVGLGNDDPTIINVYPNPAENYVNVKVSNGSRVGTVNIYSITGNLIKVAEINGIEREIEISDIPAGVYFISIDDEKESLVTKFIKR